MGHSSSSSSNTNTNNNNSYKQIGDINAYEVLHTQTQTIINILYVFVMCILPLLWFGDCKRTMSLLFKNIQMPNYYDENEEHVDFHPNLQMLLIIVGIGAYWLHRRWRLQSHYQRADILNEEASFTETKELLTLKQKLLEKVNSIIEDKIVQPLKQVGPGALRYATMKRNCPMEGILEESQENNNTSDANSGSN